MFKFEAFKNKLGLPTGQFRLYAVFSLVFFAGCCALLMPAVQNLIILFGETLVHHPLKHPVWRQRLGTSGLAGVMFYVLFFFTFFYQNIFLHKNMAKKLYILLIGFSALVIFVILFQANWVFGDDYMFLATTTLNSYISPSDNTTSGRFFPLGHIHYNILLFFYRLFGFNSGLPVEAHFALIAVFYSLTVLCLYLLFSTIEPFDNRKYPAFTVFFAGTFLLLSRAFPGVFMLLIYPETPVILLFAFFMLMYYQAKKTDKRRYYIGALLAAVYATYCKEPVFGAFLIVALTNYIFNFKNISQNKERIFYAALIANGILYIVLYYFISFRNAAGFYNEGRVSDYGLKYILYICINNPVLILMFLFGFIRLSNIIIQKERGHLYYDSLLFAGMGYVCAYILLHLNAGYYFVPAIALFLPSLVYWTKYLYQNRKQYALCLFGFIMILYTTNAGSISDVISTWQDRREFIPYIDELLLEYNKGKEFIWYESEIMDNTFYIAVRGWRKHVENAFLNYRNKTLERPFFTVKNNPDDLDMHKDILFFYSKDTYKTQSMPDSLVKLLVDNHFELYKDSYDILIYRR